MESAWINIGSTLAGVMVGYGLTVLHERRLAKARQRITALKAASGLRQWMQICREWAGDIAVHLDNEGMQGQLHGSLPDFPFEHDLEEIAQLNPNLAEQVFVLLHKKLDSDRHIANAEEHKDFSDPSGGEALLRLAQAYLDADPICRTLIRAAKCSFEASTPDDIAWMQNQVNQHYKNQQRFGRPNHELTGSGEQPQSSV